MKKQHYFLTVLLMIGFYCTRAQNWEWAENFSFPGAESNSTIGGTDKNGNLYCAVMSRIEGAHTYKAQYNLMKIDSKGKLVWSKEITDFMRASMVTDQDGNTILAFNDRMAMIDANGSFKWQNSTNGQRFFGQVFLKRDRVVVTGVESDKRTFVSEYDFSGQLLSSIYGYKPGLVAPDTSDNFFVLSMDYPDPITGNSARLRKYSNTGNQLFEVAVPYRPSDIVADGQSNVYITGYFGSEEIEIDGKKFATSPNLYGYNTYLMKFNNESKLLWYKIMTGGATSNNKISLDKDNNLYYLTDIHGETKFNETPVNQTGGSLLLTKFSPEGNLLWYQQPASTSAQGYASSEMLYVNEAGNEIFVSGMLNRTVQFGPYSAVSQSGMYAEMFVAKLSQNNSVGIVDNTEASQWWSVYPNPSGSIFSLQGPPDINGKFQITDINGRILNEVEISADHKNYAIDLSVYPKGIYFIQIKTQAGVETKKLVKN